MSDNAMVSLFGKRAGWFVAASWLLLLLALPYAALLSIGPSINLTYHPLHQDAPIDRFIIHAAYVAMAASAIAAISPSIALACKFRITASALVVGCWSLICGSYLVLLSIGNAGIRQIIGPGPQQFEHHVGSQRFVVPWQYKPVGTGMPNSPGFTIWLCGSNIQAGYDQGCGSINQVTISSVAVGIEQQFDVSFWRDRLPRIKAGGIRSGHQEYTHVPADTQGRTITTRYFARQTPDGQLLRLVTCYSSGGCRHYVRVANYALSYSAPESKLADWETMDRELTTLIDSWRK